MTVRHGELQHHIVPLISIDEFSAKTGTDDEVIVVAFMVKEELPAYDLDDFIDKGVTEVLDSEVSPNPDLNGLWMVFVELRRRSNFWSKLTALVKDIENLTLSQKWKAQVYGESQLRLLTDPKLRKLVPLSEAQYRSQRTEPELAEYFEPSALENFEVDSGSVMFEAGGHRMQFDLVDFGTDQRVTQRQKLDTVVWNPMQTSAQSQGLRHLLGAGWHVQPLQEHTVVWRDDHNKLVLLR